MKKQYCLLFFLFLFVTPALNAQDEFSLSRKGDGHLYFTAEVCGESAEIMLESGIPAFLIGRDFYERNLKDPDIVFTESSMKMRLLNNVYDVSFKAEGSIGVGKAVFEGPVFILDGYDGLSLPIQYLKDSHGGKSLISIDLNNMCLAIGGSVAFQGKESYRLKIDKKFGFPTVKARVGLETPEGNADISGDFIVDFGNPSLLFLMRQDKSLSKAVKKERIILRDARNGNGEVVAQGIYALKVNMFGREYNDVSIGVTGRMASIRQTGFLGVPFFDAPVVFDFGKGVMYK